MNYREYVKGALGTESTLSPLTAEVEARGLSNRLYHAALGISTEVSEMYDAVEGVAECSIDRVNLLEEIGDAHWYIAIAADDLKIVGLVEVELECTPVELSLLNALAEVRKNSAKLLDYTKKVMYYGKEADPSYITGGILKLTENIASLTRAITTDTEIQSKIFAVNLAKLKSRFPDKFSEFKADVRDLQAERAILNSLFTKGDKC